MQPTSRTIIERIAEALDTTVLPAIPADDKWAASTVRSAVTLLNHLAKRVEIEAGILTADNADARAVLAEAATKLRPGEDAALKSDIGSELAAGEDPAFDLPALDARNTRYQSLIDRLLRDQYDGAWNEQDAAAQPVRAAIRAYLDRRLARERDMYLPEFTGPPF